MNILQKIQELVKEVGLFNTSIKIFLFLINSIKIKRKNPFYLRRVKIGYELSELYKSQIQYGPFKGLLLPVSYSWGKSDRASMLLGLYEKEILNILQNLSGNQKYFVNLGAADGYYGAGVLVNNLFKKSICFELSEYGRKIIYEVAKKNNVLDRIEIRGIADKYFYNHISDEIINNSLLFVDIEGAEFNVLTESAFQKFHKSIIIVELHDWFFNDAINKERELVKSSIKTHSITQITTESRDLSKFDDLKLYNDDDRWIICSEGRGQLMRWFRFDPL